VLGERAFTEGLARAFAPPRGRGALGIGDDAAVVANRGAHTVVACDAVVEGVHFTARTPLALVGRKAVNRNLADLAAMGAAFDYALVSVLWPRTRPARGLAVLMRGIRAAVERHGGTVVGGATGSTGGPLTVTVTVLGHPIGRVLRRDAARAGDRVHVSGPLGGSLLGGHLRFSPPLALGVRLAQTAGVGGVIDVSDGLVIDLATMLRASSRACGKALCAVLDPKAIPVSAAARRLARRTGRTPLEHALGDGEDHVLLFTRRGKEHAAGAIGTVVAATGSARAGEVFLLGPDGRRTRVTAGYEHRLGAEVAR